MQSEGRFFVGLLIVVVGLISLGVIGIIKHEAEFVLLANVIIGIGMMLSGEHPK